MSKYHLKHQGPQIDALLDKAGTALQEHQDISHLAKKAEVQFELGKKQNNIEDIDEIRRGAKLGSTSIQDISHLAVKDNVLSWLSEKVDKIPGKQLTTEDFTTLLKQKLESLQNYDDTAIRAAIAKLRSDFDTLVESDTSGAIDKFNEIIAFLDGIEDSQSLDSIIASIEQQIAGKQSAITDLDTIRDGAAKGKTSVQGVVVNNEQLTPDTNGNISLPKILVEADITNMGFTKNKGTVTGVMVNGESKSPNSNGVVDLGEIKVDEAKFATDLTGVVEATPEMFTYRPSAGDKSVRDESAVIRRIKGNTSVWGQLIRNLSYDSTVKIEEEGDAWILTPIGNTTNPGSTAWGSGGASFNVSHPLNTDHIYLYCVTFTKISKRTDLGDFVPQDTLLSLFGNYIRLGADLGQRTTAVLISKPGVSTNVVFLTLNGCVTKIENPMLIDLTDLFGAGNEPTTYDEFRKYYPEPYYPYHAPEVRSMRATGIETVGFNLFDESKVFSEAGMTLTNDGWQGPVINVYRKLWSNDFGYNGQICVYMKSLAVNGSPNYRVKFHYTDGTESDTYSQLASVGTQKEGFAISDNGKVVDCINGYYGSGGEVLINKLCINLSHSGVRNGEYKPYEKNTLLLPEISKYFPNGMHGIGGVFDEINGEMAIQRCAVRAYEEGDENNAEVKTDKITTVYKLSEPIYTPIDEPLQLDYKVDDFGTEKMLSDAPSSPFKADIVYQFNAEGRIRDNSRNIEKLEEQLQSAKEEVDSKKQDTLSLTVKDNGNIVIGNINGQSKEFMPATPSGDPMHYYYLSHFGVTYNESTGFFELEYLKNLTANDMRNAVRVSGDTRLLYNEASSVSGLVATEDRPRTNIAMKSGNIKVLDRYDIPRWSRALEQWIIGKSSAYSFATLTDVWDSNDGLRLALVGLAELRYIVGVIDISTLRNGDMPTLLGNSTTKMQEVRLAKMKTSQTITDQKNLSKDSISYLLSNRINTEEISLSLPAELYNKIMTDGGEWEDLRSLCEATTDKGEVILELNA